MAYIGIDFGTSNSVVADFRFGKPIVLPDPEGRLATPSVVSLRRDGSIAIGQEAKEIYDERRSIRSIKRALGTAERLTLAGQDVRPEQVAVMLFSMLKRSAEAALKQPVQKAVITIPANSKGLARHATKLCAGAAGFQVLTLINEPTAAAICYGLNSRYDQRVLVYDFGGGTLDVTVLRVHHGIFEEIGSKGIGRLGGDDADQLLAELIAERFRRKTGYDILGSPYRTSFLLAVERAKIDLSFAPTALARRPMLVPERKLSLEEPVSREEYEDLIKPLVERTGDAVSEALERAATPGRKIERVLLVGGMSKTPYVREYVRKLIGPEPEPFDKADPLTCVAQGAAIVSAILQSAPGLEHHAYSVKLEHSLCACPIDENGDEFLDPIIRRGSDIPCSVSKTYYPVADPAERVVVSVYEGDTYKNPNDAENIKLAEIPWTYDPPRPQGDAGIEVTYSYGDDGILTVVIVDTFGGRRERFAIEQGTPDSVTPKMYQKMAKINEKLLERTEKVESADVYRASLDLLRRAEHIVIPKIEVEADRLSVEEVCRALRQALGTGDLARADQINTTLADRLLDFAHLL
ncbi:MAG: Hsp70 family protein [Gemmataceae bacterium]